MKYKRLLFILGFLLPILLHACITFADQREDINKLKQELIELEKVTKPILQVFQKAAQIVSPSVVSLSTEKKELLKNRTEIMPAPPDQHFPPKNDPHQEGVPKKGFGAGIIIDEHGYILTNNHVISGFSEDEMTIITYNGEQYKDVRIVGTDPNTDLAVVKIEGEGFLPAEFGNSEEVQVGDWVIAVGSPFGYQQTVSAGIISARGRTHVIPLVLPFIYEDFFQTDAAINPGNSGGPLVNLRGEVIGINTAIATRSGGFQGVGFAISASIAKETVENIINSGTVIRGYLGVGTQDITDELASAIGLKDKKEFIHRFGLPSEKGAFVMEVWSDTPASKAGIQPGDIICELDGKKVENTVDLQHFMRRSKVDSKIAVKVIRDGMENLLEVTVEKQPEDLAGKTYIAIRKLDEPVKFSFGLIVNDLNPEVAKSLGFEDEGGVVVVDVEVNSPAEHAGIQRGDLITRVGSKEINSVNEFLTLIDEFLKTSKAVSIFIKNKGFVTLK